MKFEYRVLNISELDKRNKGLSYNDPKIATILTLLNEYGADGWEVCFKLTEQSFLLKRVVKSE